MATRRKFGKSSEITQDMIRRDTDKYPYEPKRPFVHMLADEIKDMRKLPKVIKDGQPVDSIWLPLGSDTVSAQLSHAAKYAGLDYKFTVRYEELNGVPGTRAWRIQ